MLLQLDNLAADALEYQLLDRRSFLQFLDLPESGSIPDAKTIWLFRDRLAQAGASAEREQNLTKAGWRVHIHCKRTATRGISDAPKAAQPPYCHTACPAVDRKHFEFVRVESPVSALHAYENRGIRGDLMQGRYV